MKSSKPALRTLKVAIVSFLFLLALGAAAPRFDPDVAWRFRVMEAKLSGRIPEIPFRTLLRWLKPGSPVYLGGMADLPNANASITNNYDNPRSAEAGARIYGQSCAGCHGENGTGGNAPSLVAALGSSTDWSFFSTVKWGRPNTIMRAQPLSELEIWQVNAFIKRTALEYAASKNGSRAAIAPFQAVSFDMLRSAERSTGWLTYAGNYGGYRHSGLNEINRGNVRGLALAWAAQLRASDTALEATPIVSGGRMFVTEATGGVVALDAKTGAMIWEFRRPVPDGISLCCGSVNRGVAVLNDTVFVGMSDAHLIALDASTGAVRWDTTVANWRDDYSITGAPLVMEDRVVIGVGGGDFGAPGFLSAYSTTNGALQWRFNTVPGPGEPGHDTWAGDSWKHGGATTWNTGSYDPALNLIYWGTGNAAPDYSLQTRQGANLYSDSMIAVDASTGKLRWYFQFTPGDDHDWDSAEQPILTDILWHGRMEPAILQANRNGFFYALDRETGQFLLAEPYVKQTWASGIDSSGHPIVRPESHPSRAGSLVWPSPIGATNWWPPSFDLKRHLLYVPTLNEGAIYFASGTLRVRPGEQIEGSSYQNDANDEHVSMSIDALDVTTGHQKWSSTLASGYDTWHHSGGVLSTDGSIVFTGYRNEFLALDADTGNRLWSLPLGDSINAAPISYAIDGREYIEVIAGRTIFTFALPSTR